MKAVILAAGEGTRMHPLTYTRPKVMLPLANRPILEHLILELKKAGIGEFLLVVGYGNQAVEGYFGDGGKWEVRIEYAFQRKQLGTGHALGMARDKVKGDFLVANGDGLVRESDIRRLLEIRGMALAVAEVANPQGLGVVTVEEGRVKRLYEKLASPPSNLANVGLYLFSPQVFEALPHIALSPRGEYEITDALNSLLDGGYPVHYVKVTSWLDVSYPWDLLTANESLLQEMEPQNLGTLEENVVIRGPVSIGRGSVIHAGSYILGPTIIGEGVELGPNCYIRPATAIGDHCHIGATVEVKNSILMRESHIPHHNYVGDSVIGEGCNLGAGTNIANLRLDKKEVEVAGVATGRQKLGAILGDGVQTGINASINVGSLIGHQVFIGPGAVASGIIQPFSRIF